MQPTSAEAAGKVGAAGALFDLSRGKQALLSVAQPALGACVALSALPDARVVVVGLVAATAGYLAVFSLNDVLDARIDERALEAGKADAPEGDIDTAFLRHPLAAGALSRAQAVAWVAGLTTIAVLGAWALAPACLLAFAAAVGLEIAYCALRTATWTKTFLSGAMVGVGGLAGWLAVSPLTPRALPFFGLLAVWEIAGRNLPNDLADIGPDSAVGIRTVATVLGPKASAAGVAVGSALTVALAAALPVGWPLRLLAAALAIWSMALPSVALLRDPTPRRGAAYFNRASLYPALVFLVALALVAAGRL